jgi:hypothetical protein
MKNLYYIFIIILFFLSVSVSGFSQDHLEIVRQMISAVSTVQSVQYTLESRERIDNKLNHEVFNFKLIVNPCHLYGIQTYPPKGVEILYLTGKNEGRVKINPASFPWFPINLDPENPLMLNKRHHSVNESGFDYLASAVEYFIQKSEDQSELVVENHGIVKIKGMDCYDYTIADPAYRLLEYRVSGHETTLSIAAKLRINYYSLLENNPGLKVSGEITSGTRLVVPNGYASRFELFIHQDKLYPVCVRVYDPKGLFEEYTFINVILNPVFGQDDFSADNPEYGF